MSRRTFLFLQIAVLAVLVGVSYAPSLRNPFEFDDWHVIPQNPSVRSLADVPSFFTDPTTFSILEGNRDYRPMFLTSMALCWSLGDGETWPFHVVSLILHWLNAVLVLLILRFAIAGRAVPARGTTSLSGNLRGSRAARHGEALRGEAQRNAAQSNAAQSNAAQSNAAQSNAAQPNAAQRDEAQRNATQRNATQRNGEHVAFVSAALFAVHPLASQSVVYISSQSVPITAVFYLTAFLLYVRSDSELRQERHRVRWLWALRTGSVLCFFLALLSKPIAITLPVNLLLWELLCGDRSVAKTLANRTHLSSLLAWARRLIPYAVAAMVYIYIRGAVLPNAVGPSETIRPRFIHYLTETKALVFYYLKLAFLPLGQNIDPEFAEVTSATDPTFLVSVAVIVTIAIVLWFLRGHRHLVFWTLWFPVCLLVTTYATVLGQIVNEHRVYLSLIGFTTIIAIVTVRAARTWSPAARRGLVVVGCVLLALLSAASMERSRIWSSGVSLWGDAAANGGTWRAHMNYALALEEVGRSEEALFEFQEAVRLGPYAWAHINLGHAYVRRGRVEEGLPHLRQAVRLWPDLAEAHLFLGYGLDQAGNVAEAEREMRTALSLRDNYVKGYQFLAEFYERHGRVREARQTYQELLSIDPHQGWAKVRLDTLEAATPHSLDLIRAGQFDEALVVLEGEYARKSSNRGEELLFNLGFTYQRLGRRGDSIRVYEELLEVAPRHRQGLFNLAYAYRDEEDESSWARSAALFREVLAVDPGYDEAHHHLATVLRKLGRLEEADVHDRRYVEVGTSEDLRSRSRERLDE